MSRLSSASQQPPLPPSQPQLLLLMLLMAAALLLLEAPIADGIAPPAPSSNSGAAAGAGESQQQRGARKVQAFIDLEKLNFYRGLIRRLVTLDDEVSCLGSDSMSLSCPDRSQIFITSVTLKRSARRDCPASAAGSSNDSDSLAAGLRALSRCGISRALQVVKLRCEERQRCSLLTPPTATADPYDLGRCEQLLSHLSVRFTCEPAIRNRFLCADTYSTISCEDRQKLMVLDAVLTDKYDLFQYGRCPNTANPSQGASNCPETNVFDEFKRQCDSRPDCTVGALHSVKPGCARPNLLMLYACVPKKGYDPSKRDDLPSDRKRIPTVVYGPEPEAPADVDKQPTQPPRRGQSSPKPADSSSPEVATEDSQLTSMLPQLSGRQAAVLGASAVLIVLLSLVTAAGCAITRRWLRGRRLRADEHLARVRLGKQIPPPATCLVIPPAETLLKLPSPHSSSGCGGSGGAHTVSVCLSQLGSPPRCGSIDGSGSGSGAGGSSGVGCSNSDRQSTSTSTFLMSGGGSAASRAGSLPSPRESLATYSLQQHQCATSVLEEQLGPQQLGML